MSTYPTPVHVRASLDPQLSRWLWLVKWLLAIPHYIVLAFLWIAFFVLTVVAFVAILFTGRYPHSIFDFNVGVLRWSWRVGYYTYSALGTDRYPPFTLAEVPQYPATFSVDYPEHLSRGLVLVKWWLLALPHYLVVGLLTSATYWTAREADTDEAWRAGGGLIGLLVLIAAVILLFTGSYPKGLFNLIIGLNRWVLRVAAYAGLMTDSYPPFRLDMGPDDPGPGHVALRSPAGGPHTPATAETLPAAHGPAGSPVPPPVQDTTPSPSTRWTAGRVVALVVGSLLVLAGLGGATSGVAGLVFDRTGRDGNGYLMSTSAPLAGSGYAVATETAQLEFADVGPFTGERILGKVRVTATPRGGDSLFVGMAPSADVATYLGDVQHSVVLSFAGNAGTSGPRYRQETGGAPAQPPADAVEWVAASSGDGQQTLEWTVESGDWTIVLMNADASPGVQADVSIGATFPWLGTAAGIALFVGAVLLLLGFALVALALRGSPRV